MSIEGADAARVPRQGPGIVRLALVILLGTGAAIAQHGPITAHLGAALSVVAASVATVWLLGRPPMDRRWAHAGAFTIVLVAGAASLRAGFAYPFTVAMLGTTLAHGALVRWSPVPSLPQRRRSVAGLAVAPLILAMLSWYREGSPSTLACLFLATVAVLELYSRFEAAMDRLDAAVEGFAHLVSRGITLLFGSAVMVVVIVPINLVSRLFRYSPLDAGWTGSASAWVGVDDRRQRTPDRQPARPSSMGTLDLLPSPGVRRRSRLRLTVPVALTATLVLAIAPWDSGRSTDERAAERSATDATDTFTRPFEDDPAFDDAPWAKGLRTDLLDAWTNLEFNAAVGGWGLRDATTDFINVRNGERASTDPDPRLGEPLEVWLMGGSAAFGAGQRDEHTIASELVRLAGSEGIALRVRNFGVPATVNWQEAMLLLRRLTWDPPPDLVLVYDGANDLALQDVLAAQGKGGSDQPASLADGQLDQVLRERAESKHLDLPTTDPITDDVVTTPEQAGALVATRYRKGVGVIRRFCEEAGVPVSIFWQPELQLKEPLTDADRKTLEDIQVNDESLDRRQRFSTAARTGLDSLGVVDLTSVFDGRTDALYWDSVHTNETGSALVAAAMFSELAPTLVELSAAG